MLFFVFQIENYGTHFFSRGAIWKIFFFSSWNFLILLHTKTILKTVIKFTDKMLRKFVHKFTRYVGITP